MKDIKTYTEHGGNVYSDEGLLKGKNIIDFSSNINPLGVPKSFLNNIDEALESVIRYPDIEYKRLKKAIIEYHASEAKLEEDNIVVGNGAAEIIDLSLSLFKNILISVPAFVEYEKTARKWGKNIEFSYLKEDMDYDYEDIIKKIDGADAVILGNPNNPNGNLIHKEKFYKILDKCERENKIVIIDEAFIEFTGNKSLSFVEDLKSYKSIFIIRALTKFFALPGIRLGYGISSNKEMIKNIKSIQNPWNVNCFAETAGVYVLKDKAYIEDTLKFMNSERKFFVESLKHIDFIKRVYNTEANYVLCSLSKIEASKLYKLCLDHSVAIRVCHNYRGLKGEFVRFAIKSRKDNLRLLEVLNIISENLRC